LSNPECLKKLFGKCCEINIGEIDHRPVCLPVLPSKNIRKYDNNFVELTGWGKKDFQGIVSPTLKRVSLKIFPIR